MFRQRPLTYLFIAATLAIDVVLMTRKSPDVFPFGFGMVLGQLAAMAIWTARGQTHRLARMSCTVVAVGLLTYLIKVDPSPRPFFLAFYSVYTFLVLLVTVTSDYICHRSQEKKQDQVSANRWQVPLIEFFGWTTLVAIISFGARQMDFEFLGIPSVAMLCAALLPVPLLMSIFIRHDLRDLRSFNALLIVIAMILSAIYVHREEQGGAEWIIFVQAGYLTLWFAVLGMDDVLADAKSLRKELLKNEAVSTPQIFNPETPLSEEN